jgi:5-methyltetrahydrofolate--homocysteine methyltransferase
MAFDETGQADTYARKLAVCERAYKLLLSIGFPPEDIVFDTNVLTIATGISDHDNYAKDFIDAVGWVKQNLPYAKTSGGISNVCFRSAETTPYEKLCTRYFSIMPLKPALIWAS